MDYQLIMHLPCRCVQRVYSVFINLKVHTAQNLAVRANSVNTCLKYFFFLCLQVHSENQPWWHQMPFRVTDQMESWKEGAKTKNQPESPHGISESLSTLPKLLKLNTTPQTHFYSILFLWSLFCHAADTKSPGDCGDALFQLAHARDEDL